MVKANRLLIVLDSVGYDQYLKAYTPNMDAVGAVHLAWSHGQWTRPSMAAIFTGLLPLCSISDCPHRKLQCFHVIPSLFTVKEREGYNVKVYTGNALIWDLVPKRFLKQYDGNNYLPLVLEDVDTLGEPFYVIVHLLETHMPYTTEEEHGALGAEERQRKAIEYVDRKIKPLLGRGEVIITSDHGEYFGNNHYGHTLDAVGFQPELFKVPLISSTVKQKT